MNLKDRGITVGDLLIMIIFIIATIFIINKFNDNKEQTHLYKIPRCVEVNRIT